MPIGAFLIQHIYGQVLVLGRDGVTAYNDHTKFLTSIPFLIAVETTFIFGPIAYHGFYGLWIWLRGDSNVADYPYVGNWLYFLQRISGIIAFVYIGYHLFEMRFTGTHLVDQPEQAYQKVVDAVANPWVAAFYAVGMIAACFHFAYGLWLFGSKWGITVGERSQKISGMLCGALGVALCGAGLASLLKFMAH
jgi:succinate dehydrogenase / fumarate reductase cytochrome b subunit